MQRSMLVELWHAGVEAVDPADCVRRRTPRRALAGHRRVVVIAFGKAAAGMTDGFLEVLGRDPDDGLVVLPHGSRRPHRLPVVEAGHPLPDAGSVAAGERALRLAGAAGEDDLVVCLVSGGGSALLEAPVGDLEEIRSLTAEMMRSGAGIATLNRMRQARSRVKGGGLAAAAGRASLLTLALSDVVGDDLSVIASGPTVGDHPRHTAVVVGSAADAAEGVVSAGAGFGIAAAVATTTMTGEARKVAAGAATTDIPGADVVVYAGETTVTVTGDGRGGRNQEAAVAAAIAIAGTSRCFLAGGTDGIDGPTDAAGGVVDGGTVDRAAAAGLDPEAVLAGNDSHRLLAATGDLIVTGPTGTNVGDLWLASR